VCVCVCVFGLLLNLKLPPYLVQGGQVLRDCVLHHIRTYKYTYITYIICICMYIYMHMHIRLYTHICIDIHIRIFRTGKC